MKISSQINIQTKSRIRYITHLTTRRYSITLMISVENLKRGHTEKTNRSPCYMLYYLSICYHDKNQKQVYVYVYIYIYMRVCVCEREREGTAAAAAAAANKLTE